jgi:hypothetical protein
MFVMCNSNDADTEKTKSRKFLAFTDNGSVAEFSKKTIREMFRRLGCRFRQQTETAPELEKPSPNLTVF